MTTTFASRTRPFTSPHPVKELQKDAVKRKKDFLKQRTADIDNLLKNNPGDQDKQYWSMVYDLEHSPPTTGRAQLLEFGIVPVPPQELTLNKELHDELWTIIEALSKGGIYLINTDHLDDTNLYARLYYRILDEPCRMMPPGLECAEYIDCLHPMDLDFPLARKMSEREPPALNTGEYMRGPICAFTGELVVRDAYIPRPSWS